MRIFSKLIRHIQNRYYKNPVRFNLTLLFLTFFLTTTLPALAVIGHFSQKATEDEQLRSAQQAADNAASRILETINSGKKISTSILSNTSLHNFLQKDFHQRTSGDTALLESTLYTICSASTDRLSAYVYDKEGHAYYTDSLQAKTLRTSIPEDLPIYKDIQALEGGTLVLYTHDLYDCPSQNDGLSIIRTVNNLDSLKKVGTLVININNRDLAACFESSPDYSETWMIFNDQKDILMTVNPSKAFTDHDLLAEAGLAKTMPNALTRNGMKYLASTSTLSEYGLTALRLSPVGSSHFFVQKYFPYIIAVLTINIVIMLAGLLILSRSITAPLKHLTTHMRRLSAKDFRTLSTPYQEPNEIALLADTYNKMTQEIETLLKQEAEIQKNKRHLELNLLQAQFKPHFLYNTIDTARALCLQGETRQANLLLKAMGSYYQNILSKGKNIISIQDELNTIKQYKIIRDYKDDFELDIQYAVDESLLSLPILKFILQPLIENSIKHGFQMCGSGLIQIMLSMDADVLTLSVKDDGTGIPKAQISSILENSPASSNSFGLRATIERMRIYYGDSFHVTIQSTVNQGTAISFTIDHFSATIPVDWKQSPQNSYS